jgi:hypothetical protein
MRFNTPDEVKTAAHKSARELVRRYLDHGHDLNPYCTPGARGEFDRAVLGAPRRSFDIDPAWDYRYQLGRAVAEILTQLEPMATDDTRANGPHQSKDTK